MRPTNTNAAAYTPADPPADPAQLQRYLREEFAKMAVALSLVADGFDQPTYVAPAKSRKGMRRYADGTSWNPGAGEGLYRYNGAAWVLLG